MTSITRKRWLAITAAVVTVALLVVTMQAALAASRTWQSMEGDTDSAGTWPDGQSYGTEGIGVPVDSYHIQMGHWNKASQGPISMTFDDASATNAYQITEWADPVASGSSLDFSASTSVVAWNGSQWVWSTEDGESDDGDDNDDGIYERVASSNFHAPAVYPSFVQGCHWGQCTWDTTNDGYENAGIPYPIRARNITDLNSTFAIGVDTNADSGVWNASFDIWLDTGTRLIASGWTNQYPPEGQPDMPFEDYVGFPILPGFPGALMQYEEDDQRGQNDGAEIMIWMNNRGYGHGDGNPIRPAGTAEGMILTAEPIAIPGDPDAKWDIWVGRSGAEGYPNWNVISYVKVNDNNGANPNTLLMNFDANTFIQHAISLNNCPTVSGREGHPNGAICVDPDWWLTSVQAGFEIWDKGDGLSVNQFSVKPNVDTSKYAVQVDTGRTMDGTPNGMPQIHWAERFVLRYETTCTTGVSVSIDDNDPATAPKEYDLIQVVEDLDTDGTDLWAAHVGPLWPIHTNPEFLGDATVTFTTGCGTSTQVPVYIDPSGVVVNTLGEPIEDAKVTLQYAPGVASTDPEPAADDFEPVPNGSDIMSPANQDNPDYTDEIGYYRWDVADGWYKVTAEKDGCTSAESPALPVSEGNPATNVNLVLDCGEGDGDGPGDLLVQVIPQNDWGTGYCSNVYVTNNSSAPIDWQVSFDIEGAIYDIWNANIVSQNSLQVTIEAEGDWQNILAPGQTTRDVGFCANRTGGATPAPNPGGATVSITTQSDWGTGYCANITVTNNTSAPVDWRVTFPVVGRVNNLWNAIWSQSGNQVTAEGVNWNNILNPGTSTHSIGFCANR